MMTKIRERSLWIFVLMIVAFIALIVFEWGMDASGGGRANSNTIGKVYGVEISYQQYERAMQNAIENERQRSGQTPDNQQTEQLKQTVWDQLVRSIIIRKEVEERNLGVTEEELVMQMKAFFGTQEQFQTNGRFDEQKWITAVNDPNIPWASLEAQFLQQLPIQKLEQMLYQSAYIAEAELAEQARNELTPVTANLIGVGLRDFSEEITPPDSAAVAEYYTANKGEYTAPERAKLTYVRIAVTPSRSDSLAAYNEANALFDRVKNGENINELAAIYSDEPNAAETGGDLGWFGRGRMVAPFENAVFNASPGELLGPVKTDFGYHVIKVADQRLNDDGEEEYQVSHILKKIIAGRTTRDDAYNRLNALLEESREREFRQTAEELGLEPRETPYIEKNARFVPGLGNLPAAAAFAFSASAGTVSRIYQTDTDYYLLQVGERDDSGYKSLTEVKAQIERELRNQRLHELAAQYLQEQVRPLLNEGLDPDAIKERVSDRNIVIRKETSFKRNNRVQGFANDAAIIASINQLQIGEIGGPWMGTSASYFVQITNREEPSEAAVSAKIEELRQRDITRTRNNYYRQWYEAKLEEADVQDYRSQFNLI
jgi:parvulin-like peptidyl-prolyl isomerase